MQSNNPVLARYEKKPGEAGFAFDEGRTAYASASGAAPAATAPVGAPPADTNAEFQAITAAGGVRLTIMMKFASLRCVWRVLPPRRAVPHRPC